MSQKVADSRLQFTNAAECTAPDTFVREQTKEAFNLVEPTGPCESLYVYYSVITLV